MTTKKPFNLEVYLREQAGRIEAAIDGVLPAADERPSVLHSAMRYAVFTGGKRLRPVLCLAACTACGGDDETAMMPAVALELFHTYTLIHDDLPCMDNDAVRRGKPAVHVAFGEANALLAGDALQSLAFELVARTTAPPPHHPNQLALELALAAGSRGVVGGQVEDLASAGRLPDEPTITFIHLHKTADLFRAAVRLGAIAAGAHSENLAAMTQYGTALGLAFQITDDLLDVPPTATRQQVPSPSTCLAVYGDKEARRRAIELTRDACSALGNFDRTLAQPLVAAAEFALLRAS